MYILVILQSKVEETATAEVGAGGGGMDVDQEDEEMPDAPPVLVQQVKEKNIFFTGLFFSLFHERAFYRFYMVGTH